MVIVVVIVVVSVSEKLNINKDCSFTLSAVMKSCYLCNESLKLNIQINNEIVCKKCVYKLKKCDCCGKLSTKDIYQCNACVDYQFCSECLHSEGHNGMTFCNTCKMNICNTYFKSGIRNINGSHKCWHCVTFDRINRNSKMNQRRLIKQVKQLTKQV